MKYNLIWETSLRNLHKLRAVNSQMHLPCFLEMVRQILKTEIPQSFIHNETYREFKKRPQNPRFMAKGYVNLPKRGMSAVEYLGGEVFVTERRGQGSLLLLLDKCRSVNQCLGLHTFNEHHTSVKEKTASFTCIKKLKISAYICNAPGVNTILSGQSTL